MAELDLIKMWKDNNDFKAGNMGVELAPVESSNIDRAGHDGKELMLVEFHSCDLYRYQGVTVEGFRRFMEAKSKGKHLRAMDVAGTKIG